MLTVRRALPVLLVGTCLLQSGCTLAKPVVGVFTGPVVLLAGSGGGGGGWGCGCRGDGRAVLYLFAVLAVVGAGGGLVTGIISDVQVLTGAASDPCDNWWDPFRTNTMR